MPRGLEALLEGMGMDAPQGPHALSWDQTVRSGCDQACAAWGVPLKKRPGTQTWTPTSRRAGVPGTTATTMSKPEQRKSTSLTSGC